MSTTVLEKPPSLQDLTPEQVAAAKAKSLAGYDAEVKSREALVSQRPSLAAALDQKVQPGSKCGCGCSQNIAGFFTFQGCGCGCGCAPYTETVEITGSLIAIGPGAPQQGGIDAKFSGQATGTGQGSNINISNSLYLFGTVPDAENLLGVQLQLELTIGNGTLSLILLEGSRVLAVLYPQNAGYIPGQFQGYGTGVFSQA